MSIFKFSLKVKLGMKDKPMAQEASLLNLTPGCKN